MKDSFHREGYCNAHAPMTGIRFYCGGVSVYEEMRVSHTEDGAAERLVFRYCINHLRSRVASGSLTGETG